MQVFEMPLLRLDTLPAEIQIRIMTQIDSVKTLFAFLRASSFTLQIYQQNRNAIFTSVVYNQIPQSLLPITFAILRLQKQERSAHIVPSQGPSDVLRCESFSVLSVRDAKRLFRLHTLIDEFAGDAMDQSLKLMFLHLSRALPNIGALPSYSERHRVVRGFHHLEYMSSFCEQYEATRYRSPVDAVACFDVLSTFFDSLKFHELEEIYFVLSYLKRRLSCFLDQAEDDRFEEFVDHGPETSKGRYDWEADADDMFFSNALHGGLDDWMDNAIYSKELESIAKLFNASTPAERLDLLEGFGNVHFDATVSRRLRASLDAATSTVKFHYLPSDRRTWRRFPLDFNACDVIETIDDAPLGLVWAHKTDQLSRYSRVDGVDKISPYGLAVWDTDRLRRMGVFSRGPLTLEYDKGSLARRKNRPSVEDRAREQEDRWAAEGKF